MYDIIFGNPQITSEDLKSVSNEISDLNKKFEAFNVPDIDSDIKYPGFATALVIKLYEQLEVRRKYIFDIGNSLQINRISLYLDVNNVLTFELIDKIGSFYNVKISENDFQFDKFMLLYCEYGLAEEFSFFRILINGKVIAQNKYNFQINLPANIDQSKTLASDIQGINNAKMEIASFVIWSGTLGSHSRKAFFSFTNKKYAIY